MTVEDLILSYVEEEIGIVIHNYEDNSLLIPYFWRTEYIRILSPKGEYIYKEFHIYDDEKVVMWTIEKGKLHIYIDK